MQTKLLMSLSALFMAVLGLGASFGPLAILGQFGFSGGGPDVLIIQVAGALYLGFAILNWMARANLIGGVYSRPVAVGNFMHFAVVAVVLLKAMNAGFRGLLAAAIIYSVFAVWFGLVVFTHPRSKQDVLG
jgi:hypothetical protein